MRYFVTEIHSIQSPAKNHEQSLQEETVPTGLKLKKSPGLASWGRF